MVTNEPNEPKVTRAEPSTSRRGLDIPDDTYKQAKALAALHGETVSQFFVNAAIARIASLQPGGSDKTNKSAEKAEVSVRDVRDLLLKNTSAA